MPLPKAAVDKLCDNMVLLLGPEIPKRGKEACFLTKEKLSFSS